MICHHYTRSSIEAAIKGNIDFSKTEVIFGFDWRDPLKGKAGLVYEPRTVANVKRWQNIRLLKYGSAFIYSIRHCYYDNASVIVTLWIVTDRQHIYPRPRPLLHATIGALYGGWRAQDIPTITILKQHNCVFHAEIDTKIWNIES